LRHVRDRVPESASAARAFEEALKSLERAFANGYAPSRVRDTPYLENLHPNPQFQALLKARR